MTNKSLTNQIPSPRTSNIGTPDNKLKLTRPNIQDFSKNTNNQYRMKPDVAPLQSDSNTQFNLGGNTGGGGTTVLSPYSSRVIFWDLFLNNPKFHSSLKGDQIKMNPTTMNTWLDYRNFKSFNFLKERIKLWQTKAPYLTNLIKSENFISNSGKDSYYLITIATPFFIQSIDEIMVPNKFLNSNLKVFPAANFETIKGRILINSSLWNKLDLVSQSALLLHERLRAFQLNYQFSNEHLQNIVHMIMTKSPEEDVNFNFDDTLFQNPEFYKSKLDPYADTKVFLPLIRFILESKFDCMNQNEPIKCFYDTLEKLKATPSKDSLKELTEKDRIDFYNNSAADEVSYYFKIGLLSRKFKLLKLQNYGNNNILNEESGKYVLAPANCPKILSDNVDRSYINTFRPPLTCNQGFLIGVGKLNFSMKDFMEKLTFEINGRLDSSVDGGSQVSLNLYQDDNFENGMQITLYNWGTLNVSSDHNSTELLVTYKNENLNKININTFHKYRFEISLPEKKLSLSINDDNSEPVRIVDYQLSDILVNRLTGKKNWSYSTDNYSTIRTIQILNPN